MTLNDVFILNIEKEIQSIFKKTRKEFFFLKKSRIL